MSNDEWKEKLEFLLKMFCLEINIDARIGLTVARNVLFVHHAEKLIGYLKGVTVEQK